MRKSHIMPAVLSSLLAFGIACKKEGSSIDNPYGKPIKINRDTATSRGSSAADATSIQRLHRHLFAPTCANSGCHDGTFEPDFRTVESSFASLVNVKPIKNDQAAFNAHVLPGNADASIIIYRMTVDLGGNSGIMPLALEPGSNYPAVKDKLLNNLKQWVNKGAPDSKGRYSRYCCARPSGRNGRYRNLLLRTKYFP